MKIYYRLYYWIFSAAIIWFTSEDQFQVNGEKFLRIKLDPIKIGLIFSCAFWVLNISEYLSLIADDKYRTAIINSGDYITIIFVVLLICYSSAKTNKRSILEMLNQNNSKGRAYRKKNGIYGILFFTVPCILFAESYDLVSFFRSLFK